MIHDGIARALRMHLYDEDHSRSANDGQLTDTGQDLLRDGFSLHHEVQVRVIPDEFSRNMACYHILAEYGVLPRSTSLCHPE